MVNPLSDLLAQSFASTQKKPVSQQPAQNNLSTLKTNKVAKQAIMEQLEQTATQGKNLMKRSDSASALSASAAPSSNLPRGSLVDFLV